MNIKAILKFVEIQTKVASVFPAILGIMYGYYRYGRLEWENALLMFFSLLCIDMMTTGINNFMDYKRAIKKEGYGYEEHNALGKGDLTESQAIKVIYALMTLGVISGIGLVYRTDFVVFIIGAISFGVGVLYSWGPLPISRTPLGELVSGLFMGFIIFFLGVYISVSDLGFVVLHVSGMVLNFSVNIKEVLVLFFASLPLVTGIANIMLANNICDMEDDIVNKRYTLPLYLGKEMGLRIFNTLYILGYLSIVGMIVSRNLPFMTVLILLTALPVYRMVNLFNQRQDKAETFVIAVKSFVLISLSYVLALGLGIVIKHFF
jgi:1,4-dihydroxy-2-naphthoate octaprenyltransferase